jgi:competence protein ComEC
VVSNPAKTASGTYYRFTLELSEVSGNCGPYPAESFASGNITVLFPARILEAHYPGKLYSSASTAVKGQEDALSGLLIETGAVLALGGALLPSREDTGILANMQAGSATFLADTVESAEYPRGFWGTLAKFRALCRLEFKRTLYAWGKAGGLFLALASGASEYTDPELSALFKTAGLAHVLALSGMHLSIFSGLTKTAGKKSGKQVAETLSVGAVLVFVWFAGCSPSLRRALIFFLLGLFAKRMGKAPAMTELLAATFFIPFFLAPEDLGSVSFILSYAGLGGLLVCAAPVNRLLARIPYCYPAGSLSASAGALAATTPVSVAFWGYITPGSIVATPVVSPFITVFMVAGLVCTGLSLAVPSLLFPLGFVMNGIYQCIAGLVRVFSLIPRITLLPPVM